MLVSRVKFDAWFDHALSSIDTPDAKIADFNRAYRSYAEAFGFKASARTSLRTVRSRSQRIYAGARRTIECRTEPMAEYENRPTRQSHT